MRNRVGLGFDVHPFGTEPPLVLGGVRIADAPRLSGHSDGDVVERIASERWWVDNVDIVIAAEQPRLAPHLEPMQANLRAVLAPLKEPMGHGINVSVRPKRAEGLGAIGRAEGIAVWAVALLSRG